MKKSQLAIVALLSALMVTPPVLMRAHVPCTLARLGRPSPVGRWTGLFRTWTRIFGCIRAALKRTSNTKTPLNWKSKYGSVAVTMYEGAVADGMNEKGLVANLLYLAESKYPPQRPMTNDRHWQSRHGRSMYWTILQPLQKQLKVLVKKSFGWYRSWLQRVNPEQSTSPSRMSQGTRRFLNTSMVSWLSITVVNIK